MMKLISEYKEELLSLLDSFFGFFRTLFGIKRDPAYYLVER